MTFRVLGIEVCNRRIAMRPYDNVLMDEYKEYREYLILQKRYMYDQIRSLTGAVAAPKPSLNRDEDVLQSRDQTTFGDDTAHL